MHHLAMLHCEVVNMLLYTCLSACVLHINTFAVHNYVSAVHMNIIAVNMYASVAHICSIAVHMHAAVVLMNTIYCALVY